MRLGPRAQAVAGSAAVATAWSVVMLWPDVTRNKDLDLGTIWFQEIVVGLALAALVGGFGAATVTTPLRRSGSAGPMGAAGLWALGAIPALILVPPRLLVLEDLSAPWGALHLAGGLVGSALPAFVAGARTPPELARWTRPLVAAAATVAALWTTVVPPAAASQIAPIDHELFITLTLPLVGLVTAAVAVATCLAGPRQPRAQLAAGALAGAALLASMPDPLRMLADVLRFDFEALVALAIPLVILALVGVGLGVQASIQRRRARTSPRGRASPSAPRARSCTPCGRPRCRASCARPAGSTSAT